MKKSYHTIYRTVIWICTLLVFSSTTACFGHRTYDLSINSPGTYFFNYAGYRFHKPYHQSILGGISVGTNKNKHGILMDCTLIAIPYKERNSNGPTLYMRAGLFVNVSYIKEIISKRTMEGNLFLGLSTKYSMDDILLYVFNQGTWSEGILDQHAIETGGIGTHIGFNMKKYLTRRLYINSSIKSVNYLIATKYQTHTIFTEIGFGIRMGRISSM